MPGLQPARTDHARQDVGFVNSDPGPDRSERQRRVAEAIHSGEMEGLTVDPETRADADAYVEGEITADGLVERTRHRYRLGVPLRQQDQPLD